MAHSNAPRAVIYARFSPRPDAATSESIQQQLKVCCRYCRERGYAKHKDRIFWDVAVSGDQEDRPGLWDAVASLRKGDVLVVRWFHRLARDAFLEEVIVRQVHAAGATIEAVEGASYDFDNPEQQLTRQIFAIFAEYQKKCIAKLTAAKMRSLQRNGRKMSARPPYGWSIDPANPPKFDPATGTKNPQWLRIEPAEQQHLKTVIELYESGLGLRPIAAEMERRGIPYRDHDHWHHGAVRAILERAGLVPPRPKRSKPSRLIKLRPPERT